MDFGPKAGRAGDSGAPFARRLGALALLVVVSRAPMLNTGLGTDTDGWSLARAARSIAEHGVYRASRLPGNPVPEFGAAAVILAGDWAVNALAMLMTLAAALLFALLLRRLGARVDALAAAALAFVPAVYIASASGMDYSWALAFLLGATLAVVNGRVALAGLLLGLAIGSRITSAVFVLPLAIMAWVPGRASLVYRLRAPLIVAVIAKLVGALCYLPVVRTYGPSFLSYYGHAGGRTQSAEEFVRGLWHVFPLPISPWLVAGQGTVGVWGLLGCLALAVALLGVGVGAVRSAGGAQRDVQHERGAREAQRERGGSEAQREAQVERGGREAQLERPKASAALPGVPALYVLAWWVAIALVVWLYLRLPDDEGYLIPMVPFTLLIFATWLKPRAFRLLCMALLASPFVMGMDSSPPKKGIAAESLVSSATAVASAENVHLVLEPARGPLLLDLAKRRAGTRAVAEARSVWEKLPQGSVLIAGVLAYQLGDGAPERAHPHRTEDILPEADVRALIAGGAPLYYLPGARERTARFFRYSLDSAGVKPLPGP